MRPIKITVLLLLLGASLNGFALAPNKQFLSIEYKDLVTDEQGFISNTSGDGYLILDNILLNRAEMCGLQLGIEFKEAPQRASVFDIYWRTEQNVFSESHKSFFIINQKDAIKPNTFVIPLCKLFGFSGNLNQPAQQANISALRLDYPPNKNLSLRISELRFLHGNDISDVNTDVIVLEPYERIAANSFTSLDVIGPKLIFAFEEGFNRFRADWPFVVFWLVLIFLLKLVLILSFARQYKQKEQ